MKVGRNEPCPCGSGKKYKKCCLGKDEEARRVAQAPEPLAPPPSDPHLAPDPDIEALNARWEEFEAEDYEGQIALFSKTLDEESELMDDEMAFEMLNTIYLEAIEHNERDRFDALLNRLREHLPDVYAHDAHYYLDWRIANALAASRMEVVSDLAKEMAKTAGRHLDTFSDAIDRLAYHGQLPTLIEAMRVAWQEAKDSDDVVPWAVDDFAGRAAEFVIFEYLERHPSPYADDPELRKGIEFYLETNPESLARYLAHIAVQGGRCWRMEDFQLASSRHKPGRVLDEETDEVAFRENPHQNLFDLTVEFLGYLRREEDVPYTKGKIAREHIERYILEHHAGELKPRESMLDAAMRSKKRKHKPKPREPKHVLCPDRLTLNHFLSNLLNLISLQYFKAAATFELVPAWLRFLESRKLIDGQQHEETLRDLAGLATQLLTLLEKFESDPAVQSKFASAWAL